MPLPKGGLEQHYAMDPEVYFVHHDTTAKGQNSVGLLQIAEELTGGKGALLDIGCGRGEILTGAKEQGWRPTGIEPSATFARYAEEHSGVVVRREPVEECGFESESFDVVLLSAVLEHLYNPDQTIQEIARILRPGGALFVDVPNESGLYFRVGNFYQKLRGRDWVVNLAPTFPPFHVFGFSSRSLRALLGKHGLEPYHWRVYGGQAMVPSHGGLTGFLEQQAAHAITALSNIGSLGTYIETWAVKK
jgi:SAM-dependent methyltransferase